MGKSFIKIPLSHNATTAALIAADNTEARVNNSNNAKVTHLRMSELKKALVCSEMQTHGELHPYKC
jgi:hypothetical protein